MRDESADKSDGKIRKFAEFKKISLNLNHYQFFEEK